MIKEIEALLEASDNLMKRYNLTRIEALALISAYEMNCIHSHIDEAHKNRQKPKK